MKILLTHHQTQHSYKIAKILYRNKLLTKFFTTYTTTKEGASILPDKIKNLISNRIIDVPLDKIDSNLLLEIERLIVNKVLKLDYHTNYYRINGSFQKSIPDKYIIESDIVIGFDTSSWEISRRAKQFNKVFILDRTIGHPLLEKKIYAECSIKYPEWSKEFKWTKKDAHILLENIEHEQADYITVGGEFVKRNLIDIGVDEKKIYVNPYGVEMKYFIPKNKLPEGKINFLFLGSVIARKGIATLLSAWRQINTKDAKLTLAGYGELPSNINLPSNVEFVGKILPQNRKKLFDESHVFVFPSLFEGFGQVLTEAAASGLPIISTYNTGGIEIIENGVNGFLIEAGDEKALASRMEYFINNPDKILSMGLSKVEFVKNEFSLEAYEDRWLKLLSKI